MEMDDEIVLDDDDEIVLADDGMMEEASEVFDIDENEMDDDVEAEDEE